MRKARWPVAFSDEDFTPYLAGHINLVRHLSDRRIRKTEEFTKSLVFNAYRVTSMSDLDDTFGQWLAEARAVGDGAHLLDPGGHDAARTIVRDERH